MDAGDLLRRHWRILVVGVALLILLVGLSDTPSPEPDVNEELARTARTAVEAADRAARSNDAAYLSRGRFRLAFTAIGISVPIIAAVVLVYLCTRHRPEDAELLEQLEQRGLVLGDGSSRLLAGPDSRPELTADGTEADEPASVEQADSIATQTTEVDRQH